MTPGSKNITTIITKYREYKKRVKEQEVLLKEQEVEIIESEGVDAGTVI